MTTTVTEYRLHKRRCRCGRVTTADAPAGVNAPAVYGPNLRALAVYLLVYQHVPVARAAELMEAGPLQRTDSELTAEFGPQASQYTITGAPFALLAVLDTTRHDSHLDLFSSFWVDEWVDPAYVMRRPLVGLRVLSNVPTPSEMTKEVRKAAQA